MANSRVVLVVLVVSFFVGVFSLGGWRNVQLDNPQLNSLTDFAIRKLNFRLGNRLYWHKLVEIKSASRQVVAGLKWKITFGWKPTNCAIQSLNLELFNPEACQITPNTPEQTCRVVIYEPPYSQQRAANEPQILQSQCEEVPNPNLKFGSNGMRTGGVRPIVDLNSDVVKTAAQKAVQRINLATNSMFLKSFIRIQGGTQQVIAGMRYVLKIAIGTSRCRKTGNERLQELFVTAEHCPLGANVSPETCTATVDVRLWEGFYRVQDFRCGPLENIRRRRSVDKNVAHMEQPILGGNDGHDIHYGLFLNFKRTYNKMYPSQKEERRRFAIFQENMIKARNIQAMELGTARYGATKFADLTEEEFRKNYLSPTWKSDPTMKKAETPNIVTPESFDWRDHNAVTEVKNQGTCGSCWAFSTTGNIEGQWALKKKNLVSLSEQELVDCDVVDQGCQGGLPSQAYKEIIRLGGLEGESDYPYRGRNDKCALNKTKIKVYINDSVTISTDEAQMATWLAANGPISIGINANAMQFYFGGISHPWKIFCEPGNLDHGVLIVGYGMKGSEPYWIIKNSWGANWGEKGYYLVYRGGGVCGLNRMPTSAVVK